MGYVSHTALVITVEDWEGTVRTELIRSTVVGIMNGMACLVTPVCTYFKETHSFAVLPDGEKEGWKVSDLADDRRDKVKEFLTEIEERRKETPRMTRPALWVYWVEVTYGGDRYEAEILDQSWRE